MVETLEPIRVDDLRAVGAKITGAEASNAVHSWLGVPIEWRGAGIGLLEVDSTEPAAFSEEDQVLVATIGRALAGPIDLAARYAAEQRATALRDAFTGVISHELRTPITTIYGMSQVLRQRSETMDPETRRQSIADIEEEADRLRRLAEDLLVLSRAEGGRLVLARDPLVIRHVVRQAVESEARRWPDHRFSADVPLGPAARLRRGAARGPGAPEPARQRRQVQHGGQRHRGQARWPTRAGSRSPSSMRARACRPSRASSCSSCSTARPRPPAAHPGAGIGLFVCRQLVEAMGGRIWARPRDGRGAEFGFWLPALGEDEEG